jgi:hypothetical protein
MMHRSRPAGQRSALIALLLALLVLTVAPTHSGAQQLTIPHLDWRTVETRHFVIHYPSNASAWTLDMATRIESVHEAVSLMVGSAPSEKVTVIVQDPNNRSNGFAIPLLGEPVIYFWPTPPDPGSGIANNRGWGELLAVHEYAHIAHLTRPTRNPKWRRISRFLPARLGPIALESPRWVIEGYATYIEGRLTGMGRPHGAWRAAVLRQWALEGKLPTYAQLDRSSTFYGGSMAYLVGSAYLEWLVERKGEGDSSLVHVWRRMSARRTRSFSEAFAGVFGGLPEDLYGRFTAEITGNALEVERRLHASLGVAPPDSGAGRTVQALRWYTGSPAVSHDGALIALVRTARDEPSRVVVWKTTEEPEDTSAIRARERELKLDPEDVPAIQWRPRPRKAVATLFPQGGMPFTEPRFLPDGDHLLLTRATGRGDGMSRPDLFIWNFRTGSIRRVTHDAAIRNADPSPDGRFAVGSRCIEGICDVVRVDLESGQVRAIAAGAPRVVYDRPRYSPDGSTVAVSVQMDGRWRVALLDARAAEPHEPRFVGPADGANRYDPAFLRDGKSVSVTSDASGIQNIEVIDTATNVARPLTAVTSAALAPEPSPVNDSVYFLHLHARGLDLNVVSSDVARPTELRTSPALAPVTRIPPVSADTFPAQPVAPSHPYGFGPRAHRVLPTLSYAAEGKSFGLMLSGTDPVGRLTWVAQGAYGDRGTWRGGSLGATWRGALPALGAAAFYSENRPTRQHGGIAGPSSLDVDYLGAVARLQLDRDYLTNAHRISLGASLGRIHGPSTTDTGRLLGYAEYAGAVQQTPGDWVLQERLALHGSTGSTAGTSWTRGIASAGVVIMRKRLGIAGEAAYGIIGRDAPPFEQFVVGGTAPMFFESSLLAQRVAMPALPVGVAMGRQFASYRISTPGSGLQPYFWSASAGDDLRRWQQVVGLEWSVRAAGFWIVRLPDVRLLMGAGYSLSEPVRHRTHFYLTLTYSP